MSKENKKIYIFREIEDNKISHPFNKILTLRILKIIFSSYVLFRIYFQNLQYLVIKIYFSETNSLKRFVM